MNATELITSKGFPCVNYYTETEDGYILNILNIPHGRNNSGTTGPRRVVLLQHGLVGDCTHFLVNPVNQSLAFILADAGADVWLANSRGNGYSHNHTTLSPDDKKFWQFSFDEMAKYDIPATVKFVVFKTGVDQIYYIGHSQGTTIGFIAFGENKEVASHIKHMIALAPVARVGNTKSPIRVFALFAKEIQFLSNLIGPDRFNVPPEILQLLATTVCNNEGSVLCANVLFLLCGFNYKSLNMSRVPVYIAHYPSSTSFRDILHWAQAVNSRQFQHFDHGSASENIAHYNQSTPPLYNLTNVKVPVAVFRGGQDWLADPEDVSWIIPQLNVTLDANIPYYNHVDFIWAFDSPTVIYKKLLGVIFS
uniref:AB hydrolase-1 domain-containing protein n=1 Tax=Arion vulgaris TaxID=1028688 RepID=A0A0B7A002_9EUPU